MEDKSHLIVLSLFLKFNLRTFFLFKVSKIVSIDWFLEFFFFTLDQPAFLLNVFENKTTTPFNFNSFIPDFYLSPKM